MCLNVHLLRDLRQVLLVLLQLFVALHAGGVHLEADPVRVVNHLLDEGLQQPLQEGGPVDFETEGHDLAAQAVTAEKGLKRKLMSLSNGQELGQLADLASDWLFTLLQPIRSHLAC